MNPKKPSRSENGSPKSSQKKRPPDQDECLNRRLSYSQKSLLKKSVRPSGWLQYRSVFRNFVDFSLSLHLRSLFFSQRIGDDQIEIAEIEHFVGAAPVEFCRVDQSDQYVASFLDFALGTVFIRRIHADAAEIEHTVGSQNGQIDVQLIEIISVK